MLHICYLLFFENGSFSRLFDFSGNYLFIGLKKDKFLGEQFFLIFNLNILFVTNRRYLIF